MNINYTTLFSAAATALPAVLTVIFSYMQRKLDNTHDIEKTKLYNEQKKFDDEQRSKDLETKLRNQLDQLTMEQTHDNELIKLEKSFDIANQNRSLMFSDMNTYIQKLSEYFQNPTIENLDSLINAETNILLFLGPSDGMRLMEDRIILTSFLNSDSLDEGYRTNPSGDAYTTYISMLGCITKYKQELGLETYKN
ncbi:hypothetical protein [Weissella viridescens]|uniref:hypothetical protein n=1 Tax=Weissella viridescens TaxID=1629 RepID=UPI003AF3092B